MIEDKELRYLFQMESEEHLQSLDRGLLELEKNPRNQSILDDIFREAHSLKGSARMLGVVDMETIAHHFEDKLGQAKRGKIVLTSEMIDRLYSGLDAIQKLASEAVFGTPTDVDVERVLAELEGSKSKRAPVAQDETTVAPPDPEPLESPLEKSPVSDADTKTDSGQYRIDAIRVKPKQLDALMTHAGELTVTKIRIARRPIQMEQALALWEELSQDSFFNNAQIRESSTSAALQQNQERWKQMGSLLNRLKNEFSEDATRLELVANSIEEGIRSVRLLPMSTILNLFPRMVRDMANKNGKDIDFLIQGGETSADKRILEEMKDPLMHLIRNAIDHGVETPLERKKLGKPTQATVCVKAYQTSTNVVIEISDDGRGLDLDAIKRKALHQGLIREEQLAQMTAEQIRPFIFHSGFSTSDFVTDVSGRGVGLDVVRANVECLKGTIQVESLPNKGAMFRIKLPITLATTRVLTVGINGKKYALPVEFVDTALLVNRASIFSIEGRETIVLENHAISVARLWDLLELSDESSGEFSGIKQKENGNRQFPCIILKVTGDRLGIVVDELVDEQEIVLKPHSGILKRVRNVSGSTILGTGEVCMVLNPMDLMQSVQKNAIPVAAYEKMEEDTGKQQRVLLAEDSITTRTQEKRILEASGYQVTTAVDGMDAMNKLNVQSFDALISDIEMPNMNGLELTEKIRQNKKYNEMPVILVTSLTSEEDKHRGVEAGANAYITKGTFDQQALLDTLKRLI
ncbi:MAG: hypothetical protein B6244_10670 [Candidatus Cloacimonetes bacterium 4572_55]|nr:MAG: hypothetical protein B6244_10670 [Candidatus Cloacimonetes bacterium 4572_55]